MCRSQRGKEGARTNVAALWVGRAVERGLVSVFRGMYVDFNLEFRSGVVNVIHFVTIFVEKLLFGFFIFFDFNWTCIVLK